MAKLSHGPAHHSYAGFGGVDERGMVAPGGVSVLVEPIWTGPRLCRLSPGRAHHTNGARAAGSGAGRRRGPTELARYRRVFARISRARKSVFQPWHAEPSHAVLFSGQSYYRKDNGQAVFMIRLAEGLVMRGHEVMALPSMRGVASELVRVIVQTVPALHLKQPERDGIFRRLGGRHHRRVCTRSHPHPGRFLFNRIRRPSRACAASDRWHQPFSTGQLVEQPVHPAACRGGAQGDVERYAPGLQPA